jgi:polyisoprenoid-binding protein YceI
MTLRQLAGTGDATGRDMNPRNEVSTDRMGFNSSSAPPERWDIDRSRSTLGFTLRHLIVGELRGLTTRERHGALRGSHTVRAAIDRQSFALHWNQDLDAGGVVVGDQIEVLAKVEVVRLPDNGNPPRYERT